MRSSWSRMGHLAGLLLAALGLLAACENLGGALGKTTRTVTNKGTDFDVTYWVGKETTQIGSGGSTVSASFDASFIDIRRANGVAMKVDEGKRALDIASTFCQINRVPLAPAPGRTVFDGEGWRVLNHCSKVFG